MSASAPRRHVPAPYALGCGDAAHRAARGGPLAARPIARSPPPPGGMVAARCAFSTQRARRGSPALTSRRTSETARRWVSRCDGGIEQLVIRVARVESGLRATAEPPLARQRPRMPPRTRVENYRLVWWGFDRDRQRHDRSPASHGRFGGRQICAVAYAAPAWSVIAPPSRRSAGGERVPVPRIRARHAK